MSREALEMLMKSAGWQVLERWIEEQRALLAERVLEPRDTHEQLLEGERLKGEYRALGRVLEAPRALGENLEGE